MGGAEQERPAGHPHHPWLALASVGMGVSVAPLDTSVNVAFPAITQALSLDVSAIRWVIICYVLTYASLLLGFGRMADLFGHRRVFVAGLIWAAGALTLCARAESFEALLFARVMQGVGAALVLSVGPALVTGSLSEARRSQGVAGYMLIFSLCTALGPLTAGALLDAWGWPAVFWFRIPLALTALVLAFLVLPPRAWEREIGPRPDSRLDPPGALALAAGLACLLLGISQAGQGLLPGWSVAALVVFGVIAVGAFVRRQRDPGLQIMDPSVLRQRPFMVLNLAHIVVNGASFMVMLFVPFFLTDTLSLSSLTGGVLFALSPLGFMLASPVAAALLPRMGPAALAAAGATINAAGLALMAAWPANAVLSLVCLALALHGIGYGLFQVATLDLVMVTLPRRNHGVAGALNMVTRTTGVVLGIAAGTALFDGAGGSDGGEAFLDAFSRVFMAAALVVALTLAGLAVLRRP